MTAPTPETLDWLRQCAAAPGARWHRALLADVEGQTPPEIEPIPAEGLAWLYQSARVHGATYSQVLLHVLERIELLDKDSIEQSKSNSFCFEAVIKRLEKLEAAQQQPTVKESLTVPPTPEAAPRATDEEVQKVLRYYDLGRQHGAAQPAPPVEPVTVDARDPECVERWPDCHSEGYDSRCCRFPKSCSCGGEPPAAPTPEAAPVATDEELWSLWANRPKMPNSAAVALRACYDLGRQHGAAQPPAAQPAPPAAPAGMLVERVGEAMERNYVITDIEGTWDAQARAAIREVAAWLDSNACLPDDATPREADGCEMAAQILNREADRG